MIKRQLSSLMRDISRQYPVITVFGPRQSGKTTAVRDVFPNHEYVNLEDRESRNLAAADAKAFFANHPPPVILDEIQHVPGLASSVQVLVDERRHDMGRFILTGSHQPLLAETVSQSLAGRTAILDLYPPAIPELGTSVRKMTADALMHRGFMPELWRIPTLDPTVWYRNYFRTYVERDVRKLVNVRNTILFEKFVTLLAGRVGQLVNLHALAGEVGVSSTTLGEWLSILESSFLVFRLPPCTSNISKRVVKSPKVYFTEVGLAVYLLGLETPAQVARDPLRGNLFENMVIADAMKQRANLGKDPRLSFLRTGAGFEIDLITSGGGEVRPIEIKSSMSWHSDFASGPLRFATETPRSVSPTVIYDGADMDLSNGVSVRNFRTFRLAGQ
ncbi:MAG: ATP-binding protein [Kiritimatiellae bacterium]|nr:ATP-binding protein [Kiritimatiellia bacterium]